MKTIDEGRLESELGYRFEYLTEFMGFGEEDVAAVHGSVSVLAPLVPALVDAVYAQLYKYTATWRHFVPRQDGYDGEVPESVEALSPDHPQIAFRKNHLARYLEALVTRPYDEKMLKYLDMVGRVHTSKAGNAEITIPLVQMNALMGFVSDAVIATVMGADLPIETKVSTVRAFNKLLWIQQDLITRHRTV